MRHRLDERDRARRQRVVAGVVAIPARTAASPAAPSHAAIAAAQPATTNGPRHATGNTTIGAVFYVGVSRQERSRRVLGVLAALAIARGVIFMMPGVRFDADQAVVGLMAKHISEGRAFPVYFYGQSYLLAVEAYLAAPVMWLLGPTEVALKLPLAGNERRRRAAARRDRPPGSRPAAVARRRVRAAAGAAADRRRHRD